VGTAGGLGGLTVNDQVGLLVSITNLMRGLILEFSPRYTSSKSEGDEVDVDAFRLALQATYQINRWLNAVGGYEFFRQRSDGTLTTISGRRLANDADQNRVYIGLQVAYPIRLD
jgi:predicted porin